MTLKPILVDVSYESDAWLWDRSNWDFAGSLLLNMPGKAPECIRLTLPDGYRLAYKACEEPPAVSDS